MKPIGRERNKQIAEAKGYEIGSNPHGEYYIDLNGHMRWFVNSAWSDSRVYAWELWDELPEGKSFVEYKDYCHGIFISITFT